MKISIHRNSPRKTKRNLSHEVSTTADFGFCQPIVCREMVSQDSFRLRLGQIVRLQPMPVPTFGSIQVKNYTAFVPFADIFHPYESLLSGQTYAGASSRYIPISVPKVRLNTLAHILTLFSSITSRAYTGVSSSYGTLQYTFSPVCRTVSQTTSDYIDWLDTTRIGGGTTYDFSTDFWSSYGQSYRVVSCDGTGEQMQDSDFYADLPGPNAGTGVLISFKYNRWSKNLRKIFIGCGYQIDGYSNVEVSFLPLIAYYKVWFDYFQPARDKTWKDTNAFALMEFLEQNGISAIDDYLNDSISSGIAQKVISYMVGFFHDLAQCYHVANHDYASAHITGVVGDLVPTTQRPGYASTGTLLSNSVEKLSGKQASLVNVAVSSLSAQSLDMLKKLTQRVSIHTAIGGRIKEFLRSVYNSDFIDVHDSYQLGTSQFDVQIEPVFSTADTSSANLGEFAGRALGADDGSKNVISYTAKVPGILITLSALVPVAKMAQGIDPNLLHLVKEDFFDPTFDGSTLVPTKQICIYGLNNSTSSFFSHTGTFGNIPIYSEYKIANNKLNGDMSLPSAQSSYLPFTLDKLLPMPSSKVNFVSATSSILNVFGVPSSLLAAGSIWRYTNLYPWLGNYNRVFINSGDTHVYQGNLGATWSAYGFVDDIDDNFIIHNHIDLEVVGMPQSFADSWYTGAGSDSDMNITQS